MNARGSSATVADRFAERVRTWRLDVERVVETETSLLGFGYRAHQPVVLKVLKAQGGEWSSGPVVRAFDGRGVVRAYDYADGALLLERLDPGHSLVPMSLGGADDEAVDILAGVISRMADARADAPPDCATVEDWGNGFARYIASGDRRMDPALVEEGQRRYLALASSQRNPRLLHGDLHHGNVLFDSTRGWLATDPKGVVGETEYELGALLRNPIEGPHLFVSSEAVERRLARLGERFGVDIDRTLEWAFAQAVLSTVWSIEDGFDVEADNAVLRLARTVRTMLSRFS